MPKNGTFNCMRKHLQLPPDYELLTEHKVKNTKTGKLYMAVVSFKPPFQS